MEWEICVALCYVTCVMCVVPCVICDMRCVVYDGCIACFVLRHVWYELSDARCILCGVCSVLCCGVVYVTRGVLC